MTPKTFPPTPKATLPEEKILEQGLERFFQDGVRGFTVEALARDLLMSKKTIYKFFPSKEILLRQIFKYVTTLIAHRFRSIIEKDIHPLDKIGLVIDTIVKTVGRVTPARISELKARHPLIWKDLETFRMQRRDDFLEIFKEAQSQGLIRTDIDIELTATLFMNIINEVFQPEFFIVNNLSIQDTILTFKDVFIRGMVTAQGLTYLEKRV